MMSYSKSYKFRGRPILQGSAAIYHVVSRTAFALYAFDATEKERFVRFLHKQAGFCGVQILAYCVMSNHFHLLVKVPEPCPISDAELLQRYRLLYGKSCPPSSPKPDVLEKLLQENNQEGQELRERILARMHDLAVFMRELKQRFGIWYNHRHGNKGTLWSERFRSTIVEESAEALSTVAAYIDLNPVRAKMVDDPSDYRFSSYGRAVGGERAAQVGYEAVFCQQSRWKNLLPSYNLILYGKGEEAKGTTDKDFGRIDLEKAARVLENGGRLPLWQVLRLRVRYFSEGTALGSKAFLEDLGTRWNKAYGGTRVRHAHCMQAGEWGELRAYRNLQVDAVTGPSAE
ncbi:MAG: transposase [Puniceicoccaceae bacterium]|nr:MAG: transposase [Puniceicoccaceae bacterium]